MRHDTKTRDRLRFAPENNQYGGDYNTDWSTGLRHIKPCPQLAVNEGGMIFLTTDMHRDPGTRGHMAGYYDIEVMYAGDLPSPMYAPGTDRKITKRSLQATTFLVDRKHHRVLAMDKHMYLSGIRVVAAWTTVMSPARTFTPLYTKERNMAREKAWKAEHADTLLQARAVRALDGRVWGTWENLAAKATRLLVPGKAATPVNKPLLKMTLDEIRADYLLALGSLMEDHADKFTEFVVDITADRREYPHLVTKPFAI